MIRAMKLPFTLATLFASLLLGSTQAATIIHAGSDTTTGGAWRTSSVTKTLDGDGNNIYGTDGYLLTTSTDRLVNPSYATITRASTSTFGGISGYTLVDNPTGGAAVQTGVW